MKLQFPMKEPRRDIEAPALHEAFQRSALHIEQGEEYEESNLSHAEASELVRIFQDPFASPGIKIAAEKDFVLGYLPLIRQIAKKYVKRTGFPLADIVNDGVVGLYTLLPKIDLERTDDIRAFLTRSVSLLLLRGTDEESGNGLKPARVDRRYNARRLEDEKNKHWQNHQKPLMWSRELFGRTGMTQLQFDATHNIPHTVPLEGEIGHDTTLLHADHLEMKTLKKALQSLSPRERDMVSGRFVDGETGVEIGKIHGVTRERVRQIFKRIFEKVHSFFVEDLEHRVRDSKAKKTRRK